MSQTEATRIALEEQGHLCQHHLYVRNQYRHIFEDYVFGYHPRMAGGHHLAGRARVDEPELILALCSECHTLAENNRIKPVTLLAIASKRAGVDLHAKYRQEWRITESEWQSECEKWNLTLDKELGV